MAFASVVFGEFARRWYHRFIGAFYADRRYYGRAIDDCHRREILGGQLGGFGVVLFYALRYFDRAFHLVGYLRSQKGLERDAWRYIAHRGVRILRIRPLGGEYDLFLLLRRDFLANRGIRFTFYRRQSYRLRVDALDDSLSRKG